MNPKEEITFDPCPHQKKKKNIFGIDLRYPL
jgi:hypothetical protein